MFKKFVCACFVFLPTLFVSCFLFAAPVFAQNGEVAELEALSKQFSEAAKAKCGKRAEAVRIGKLIVEKYAADKLNKTLIDYVRKETAMIEKEDKECNDPNSLFYLYDLFKTELKKKCGEREDAIRYGKLLLEKYAADPLNPNVIEYVRNRVEKVEKEDAACIRYSAYNRAYRNKNWASLFTVGKMIIDAEGDTPTALDVMIDLAQVGYDLAAYEETDAYNVETAGYAVRALELIEKGVSTNGCWGAFNCYKSREKTLGWLNYIVGYISYFRLDGDKKALPYFYKATQYQMEFKYDAFIYQAVAKYYFEQQAGMTSGLGINDFINRAQNLGNRNNETGNNYTQETAEDDEIKLLYKQLVNLYNLRYNLEENENVTDLGAYIQILLDRPLLEPSKDKGKSNK